jgi:hypothetical protein
MDPLTLIHVILSLVGIAAGLVVVAAMIAGRNLVTMTAIFLWTTVLTSVTGYFFRVHKVLPSHIVGAISLVLLAVALYAWYGRRLAGGWRRTYAITAVLALYLNCFVLVVQLFLKVPALHALAPTGTETPFKISQLVLLIVFLVLTVAAAIKFREPVGQLTTRSRAA